MKASIALRRDWAFWLQGAGIAGLWTVTLGVGVWFGWRAFDLHAHGDRWVHAIVVGSLVTAVLGVFAGLMTYVFVKIGARGLPADRVAEPLSALEEHAIRSVVGPAGRGFWAAAFVLAALLGWGLYGWWTQLTLGLGETGLTRPVFWGWYIVDFVFFIGISYGGTLTSAILRLTNAEWRRSITRAAEALAVLALLFGAWNILLDLGRLDRMGKVFERGRLESPLLWDVWAISLYLVASVLYAYLPLLPDLALLRDRVRGFRRPLYHLFSFGWSDTPEQRAALERAMGVMTGLIVPLAVMVHSVVAWVFALTIQPMWHSTIFAPYFVMGAIFSGLGALVLVLATVRRTLRLEAFLRDVHFESLGRLLLLMTLLWAYLTLAENLTVFYGGEPSEMAVFDSRVSGPHAPAFFAMLAFCFVLPFAILVRRRTRTVRGTVVASASVVLGMWLERYLIVVPSLENPRLPLGDGVSLYEPSWVEVSLLAGSAAGFALLFLVFSRLFPLLPLWELRHGRSRGAEEASERIGTYFPPSPSPSVPSPFPPSREASP